jgi:hypothetical protein
MRRQSSQRYGVKSAGGRDVSGYHVHASDGVIGQVAEFLVEDGSG